MHAFKPLRTPLAHCVAFARAHPDLQSALQSRRRGVWGAGYGTVGLRGVISPSLIHTHTLSLSPHTDSLSLSVSRSRVTVGLEGVDQGGAHGHLVQALGFRVQGFTFRV
jgi:hypothetical protein